MTHSTKNALGRCANTAEGKEPATHQEGSSMTTIDQDGTYEKVTCTGDVWCGCECHACTVTFEHCDTEPLTVPTLLVEADQQLDEMTVAVTQQFANSRPAFPLNNHVCRVRAEGNRIYITAAFYDAPQRRYINREFMGTFSEVTA